MAKKAVFIARFFAGVRIGVYAYAGYQRMRWTRFLLLDFLGALISSTLSIWVGQWAALKFADNIDEAKIKALEIAQRAGHWILFGIVTAICIYMLSVWIWNKRHKNEASNNKVPEQMAD